MPDLTICGVVVKSHGLKGQVIIHFYQLIQQPRFLTIALADGNSVPYRITLFKPHQKEWLVAFEGLNTVTDVGILIKRNVLIDPQFLKPTNAVSRIGYQCFDKTYGFFGIVSKEIKNQNAQWFEIEPGNRIIPQIQDWIKSIDASAKTIHFELPDRKSVV